LYSRTQIFSVVAAVAADNPSEGGQAALLLAFAPSCCGADEKLATIPVLRRHSHVDAAAESSNRAPGPFPPAFKLSCEGAGEKLAIIAASDGPSQLGDAF
jgi:hypothetical protein